MEEEEEREGGGGEGGQSGGGGRVCLEQIGNVYAHRPPPFLLLLQPKNSNPEGRARARARAGLQWRSPLAVELFLLHT